MDNSIEFRKTTDSPEVVDKNSVLTTRKYKFDVYGNIDYMNPVLILKKQYVGYAIEELIEFNYARVFNRYYYITQMTFDSAERITISLSLDVLKTYKDIILDSTATVVRSESVGKPTMVVDNQLPVIQGKYNITSAYLSGDPIQYSESRYVLTTLGG